jgi:hypothetical protein
VSGLQHFRTIRAHGHFSAHGMPNGARVVSFRARAYGREGLRATPRSPS